MLWKNPLGRFFLSHIPPSAPGESDDTSDCADDRYGANRDCFNNLFRHTL